jgi:hypothetical protein
MKNKKPDQRIERERGMTYAKETFAVYEYSRYDRNSVLAGQQRRQYLDGDFETVADALKAFPNAVPSGCGYTEPVLSHLPDAEGSDPYGDNEDAANDY